MSKQLPPNSSARKWQNWDFKLVYATKAENLSTMLYIIITWWPQQ